MALVRRALTADVTVALGWTVATVETGTDPKLWPAGAIEVPLALLLRTLRAPDFSPNTYRDLSDMVTKLREYPIERVVIDELIAVLQENGSFDTPLRVEGDYLTNGCHRLAALVAIGASSARLWVVRDGVYEPGYEVESTTEAVFILEPAPGHYEADHDAFCDIALWVARSLNSPLGWIECDGGGLTHKDGVVEATYDYYTTVEQVESALPLIHARFANQGICSRLKSLTTVTCDD